MNMTKGFQAAQRIARALDAPQDAISAAPRITVSGGASVLVEGHRGLLEYSDGRIAAAGAGCRILIKGEALALTAMDARNLAVSGRIWAVELE